MSYSGPVFLDTVYIHYGRDNQTFHTVHACEANMMDATTIALMTNAEAITVKCSFVTASVNGNPALQYSGMAYVVEVHQFHTRYLHNPCRRKIPCVPKSKPFDV